MFMGNYKNYGQPRKQNNAVVTKNKVRPTTKCMEKATDILGYLVIPLYLQVRLYLKYIRSFFHACRRPYS